MPESGGIALLTFQEGQWGQMCLFHKSTIGNFMVYQDRIEIHVL